MIVNQQVVDGLDVFLKEHLEADIVAEIARRLNISSERAFSRYFESSLPARIEAGEYGIQYLPADYLADEVLRHNKP